MKRRVDRDRSHQCSKRQHRRHLLRPKHLRTHILQQLPTPLPRMPQARPQRKHLLRILVSHYDLLSISHSAPREATVHTSPCLVLQASYGQLTPHASLLLCHRFIRPGCWQEEEQDAQQLVSQGWGGRSAGARARSTNVWQRPAGESVAKREGFGLRLVETAPMNALPIAIT